MALTYQVVMENGRLRPLEPVPLQEGEQAEISLTPTGMATSEESLSDVLRDIREEAAQHSDEWWDDFERIIQENRVTFAERL